ncbi:MAG: polyribonucleotide nucleotidyltransferase [Dehalococcoidia bacterium]|nr:polyribonucleotide nucleotidyltransferase [Dehalococcoidia bacterium]
MAQPFSVETTIAGRRFCIETGKVAGQADAAITVRYGDTVILVAACIAPQPRDGVDFLPLTIDFEERLYAAGKIPGGFIRREGRPTEEAILTSRLTDRPLRPLLPKTWRRDIQVVITVLSADRENDPDVMAIVGGSCALGMSGVPFDGPVGACHVGCLSGELVLNPTLPQMEESTLDLVVASTKKAVVMIEAGAKEISDELMAQAIEFAHRANQELIALQEQMIAATGGPKETAPEPLANTELVSELEQILEGRLAAALGSPTKTGREPGLERLKLEVISKLQDRYPETDILASYDKCIKNCLRESILKRHVRVSGRGLKELRPITCEVGVLPRVHGSALFTRGETQVLTVTTLGSMREEQQLDGLGIADTKRFMHHYNFPPFSTGEVRRVGSPGRREIGHGALAERAIRPVVPDEQEFPYTIRAVSEVLSSSGSTSMGSTCATSLSLMDAGIPVAKAVAGISLGLVTGETEEFAVLTDIEGMEDNYGDMDFKVAGTRDGITALQLDIKIKGISLEIIDIALSQGKEARFTILDKMDKAISAPRTELSKYAPRMIKVAIDPEKIGTVIGPGGKTIRAITDETKATIDIEQDGTVFVGAIDEAAARRAIQMINDLTREVKVGEIFTGKVVRIMSFGAFVELLPGKDGMVHASELAEHRVDRVEDVVKIGSEITVKVIEIDSQGRINLSRRALLAPGDEPRTQPSQQRSGPRPSGSPYQGGRPHPPTGNRPFDRQSS